MIILQTVKSDISTFELSWDADLQYEQLHQIGILTYLMALILKPANYQDTAMMLTALHGWNSFNKQEAHLNLDIKLLDLAPSFDLS